MTDGAAGTTRAREADLQTGEAFVRMHYRGIYRFFVWLTRSPDTAADLTQETFAAFWEARAKHRLPEDPGGEEARAWLYGIARNRWRKRCRDAGPPAECLDEALAIPSEEPGPDARLFQRLDWERVSAAAADMPLEYREALVLRVWAELSYAEIAEALGIGEGLARWRVHRGRSWLRATLAREGAE